MSYEQHMRHRRNHRKDRFYQQCGGPVNETPEPLTKEQVEHLERQSFLSLIEKAKGGAFPIFIRQISGGAWCTTSEGDCFGQRIESLEELLNFFELYV